MQANFSEEIDEILSHYFSNYEISNSDFIHKFKKSSNTAKTEKENLLINSEITLNIDNLSSSIFDDYDKIIFNSRSHNEANQNKKIIQILSDINNWTFRLNLFDNIINVFNLHIIKDIERFIHIMNFSLKDGGSLGFVFLSKNNFSNLIKKLIEIDSRFNDKKIIQRFNFSHNFEKMEHILQALKFRDIAIIKENMTLKIRDLKNFLCHEKYNFLFTKDHYLYSEHILDNLENKEYEEELEILIVQCKK